MKVLVKCPECNANMVGRQSRYGWFFGCSTYPKCKHIVRVETVKTCPKCYSKLKEVREDVLKCVKCSFEYIIVRYTRHSVTYRDDHSIASSKSGWTDADWQEYADYSGFDMSDFY